MCDTKPCTKCKHCGECVVECYKKNFQLIIGTAEPEFIKWRSISRKKSLSELELQEGKIE